MKLKPSEHQAFLKIMKEQGIDPSSLSFSKKRGLVYIKKADKESPFTFYRKKVTRLNEDKQWEDRETYYLELASKGVPAMTWEEVLDAFAKWI